MVTNELTFYLAAAALLILTVESCVRLLKRDSFGIAIVIYVTVFAWYFVDPFLNPEEYGYLPPFLLGQSYGQVLLFLIGFRVVMPAAARWVLSRPSTGVLTAMQRLTPERILIAAGTIWFLLCAIGIARMGGDVIGAMFPVDSRAGVTMWARGAVESSATGFLIASAAYVFNAVTASLGVLIFFQRTTFWRRIGVAMFAITLPYFFLQGARSAFLAAILPFIITYLLYGRRSLVIRLAVLAVAFVCLDQGFRFVTAFRNTGFRDLLAAKNPYELVDELLSRVGLNMIEELCCVDAYVDSCEAFP